MIESLQGTPEDYQFGLDDVKSYVDKLHFASSKPNCFMTSLSLSFLLIFFQIVLPG